MSDEETDPVRVPSHPNRPMATGMGTIGGGAGGAPRKESRIADALSRLDNESGNLMDVAVSFLKMVEPVMSPQEPEDKVGQTEMQVGSDVVTRIDIVTERLLAIRYRLETGSRRLEI